MPRPAISQRLLRVLTPPADVCATCKSAGGMRMLSANVSKLSGSALGISRQLASQLRCGDFVLRRRYSTASPEASSSASADCTQHVLDVLQSRNLLQAATSSSLRQHLGTTTSRREGDRVANEEKGGTWIKRTIYTGVDPSADSLHVGNLLPLLTLLWLAKEGHRIIVLVSDSEEIGEATGSIGDPSGRSSERNALSPSQLAHNVKHITAQVHAFFRNACRSDAEAVATGDLRSSDLHDKVQPEVDVHVLNNVVWYEGMNVLRFLGDIGRHARVGTMMARDSVKSRLFPSTSATGIDGQSTSPVGMSFTEFSYQLLQAYDFHVLNRDHDCTVQIGGSDQMGNIMAGVDLIRRLKAAEAGQPIQAEEIEASDSSALSSPSSPALPAYGLTLPLLTTSSGAKFGKSAGNAVWLDPARLPDLDFYQFFLRTPDADVALYLRALTLAPLADLHSLLEEHSTQPSLRLAQRRLAQEVTRLVRGPDALRRAQIASQLLFECALGELTASLVKDALPNDPRLRPLPISRILEQPEGGTSTILNLAHEVGLGASKGALRRLMANGGLYFNDQQIRLDRAISSIDLQGKDRSLLVLRAGKTDHRIVIVEH